MSTEEARAIAAHNPLSFLHVSKPEIDFPPGTDPYSQEVYEQGRENFRRLIAKGALCQDAAPAFYLYRQIMGSHSQTGLVGVASCEEYLQGIVKRHELTRPDKEDDRVRHIETLDSQTGPVFLTYRSDPRLDQLVATAKEQVPDVDFTSGDGVQHTSWSLTEPDTIRTIEDSFRRMPALYIADGHHRSAAAARVHRARGNRGHAAYFLAVLFPHHEMQILPYNRVVKDLNGMTPAEFLARLSTICIPVEPGSDRPARRHEISLYLDGKWLSLAFRKDLMEAPDPADRLDVSVLQRLVLQPMLGVDDPRTSTRIQFVGGIRGTRELERLVNGGEFACAFSLFPTSIDELMHIADQGGIMPPKSTWFEPKLRDAMYCHMI